MKQIISQEFAAESVSPEIFLCSFLNVMLIRCFLSSYEFSYFSRMISGMNMNTLSDNSPGETILSSLIFMVIFVG